MTNQQKNRISSGIAATVATAAVAVAGVVGYFTLNNSPSDNIADNPPIVNPSVEPNQTQTPPVATQQAATVYWLEPSGTSFNLVPKSVPVQADVNEPSEFLEAAFTRLLAGPTEGTESTTIPQGTRLLDVKAEGDEVRVNLSEDFQFGGGSTSMIGRVGQIVYTATALNENAKVYLELDGKPLEVLGGEGLELQQPLTRDNYMKNFEL